MRTIIKSTLKLLFRNPGFWFFILITPLLATFILKNESHNMSSEQEALKEEIIELKDADNKVAYYGGKDNSYIVKVYDASESDLSEYILEKLSESGMIKVCRAKTSDMTEKDLEEHLKKDGYEDRMGAVICIKETFADKVVSGDYSNELLIYNMSDDERIDLLKMEVKIAIGQIKQAGNMAENSGTIKDKLDDLNKMLPEKTVVSITTSGSRNLTDKQLDQMALVGYAFSFLTLGFVFSGVLVAHTVIKEQNDMVLTRIRLTNISDLSYYAGKFIVGVILSLIMTAVLAVGLLTISTDKLGMGHIKLLAIIFFLGLIFNSISMVLGIILGNVMSANIAAFALWSMSSLLAGLYFPLDSTTKLIKTLSYMMPQKWFMDIAEMIMVKDNNFYFTLVCVTISYMVITFGLGSVGIKFRNDE